MRETRDEADCESERIREPDQRKEYKDEREREKEVQRARNDVKEAAISTRIRSRQFASSHSIREQFCQ